MFLRRSGAVLRRSPFALAAATAPTQLEVHLTFVSVRPFCAIGALRRGEPKLTLHSHCFLSASQVVCAQAATARNSAAGLSVTLPPLCVWGACTDTGCAVEYLDPQHGSRARTGNGSAKRYSDVWAPIESYLAPLSATATDNSDGGEFGATPAGPSAPLCLVLRLFPDLTIAQLPTLHRSVVVPHEYPLEVIVGTEELWGGGADPRRVFRDAIDCLHELGQRFLPKLPLVLQLPTRLLVSQQFLHDLAMLLVQDRWRSVAFELPSTHQLYSCSAEGGRAGEPALSAVDAGAVDAAWCRLPILCTPWTTLCRHPKLGQTLRQLRRHDVVPFHVLYSWAVAEKQLFKGLELSIVVDTTAPMPGEEALHAYLQSPGSVGRPAEELHCASPLPRRQLGDSTDAALSFSQTDGEAHLIHRHLYVSENPTTARGAGVCFSNAVIDAVRRRNRSATPRESGQVGFDDAEKVWQLQTCASTTSPPGCATAVEHRLPAPSEKQGDLSLILDAPPDHLRALIEKSINDGDATLPPALSQRQYLFQKVGQFVQRTMKPPTSASDCATVSAYTAAGEDDQSVSLEKQAEELEKLLRGVNDACDAAAASSDVETMLAEMKRYMRAHGHPPSCAAEDDAAGRASYGPSPVEQPNTDGSNNAHGVGPGTTSNPWSAFPGYWSCIHTLVQEVTHATLLFTAPTFHKAAVQAWTGAYHASRYQIVSHCEACVSATCAPLPLVVPVYMPVQSAMRVEVERLLREGRWFEQPPLLHRTEEGEALHTWLPAPLNAALADALSRLPGDYRARERRRLLRDYRRLRKEGAQAARRRVSVMEFTATPPTCSAASGNEEDLCSVRILINEAARPLYLLTPTQAEKRESRALKEAAAARQTAREEEARLYASVRGADKAFTQAIEEGYCAVLPMSDAIRGHRTLSISFVHVPSPGLSGEELCRSWHSLSS